MDQLDIQCHFYLVHLTAVKILFCFFALTNCCWLVWKYFLNSSLHFSDTGFAFFVVPRIIMTQTYIPRLWLILFFTLLVCLSFSSEILFVESVIYNLKDYFGLHYTSRNDLLVQTCSAGFLLGLLINTQAGNVMFYYLWSTINQMSFTIIFFASVALMLYGKWFL